VASGPLLPKTAFNDDMRKQHTIERKKDNFMPGSPDLSGRAQRPRERKFTARDIEPLVARHAEALRNVCKDVELFRGGQRVIAAVAFSTVFPSLFYRGPLTHLDKRHHYDLCARKFYGNLLRFGNGLGYEIILPIGTIAKLLNHLTHRRAFLHRAMNSNSDTDMTSLILSEMPPILQDGFTATNMTRYLENALLSLADTNIKPKMKVFCELISSGMIRLPQDIWDRCQVIAALGPDDARRAIISDMIKEKTREREAAQRPYYPGHVEFESTADAMNIMLSARMPQIDPSKTVLFFTSAKKRQKFGEESNLSSRHMLSLFYWGLCLARDPQYADRAINTRRRQIEIIESEIYALIDKGNDYVYEDLSDLFTRDLWIPFITELGQGDREFGNSDPEAAARVQRSLKGDHSATREIVRDAAVSMEDAMAILGDVLDRGDIDTMMEVDPTIHNNERWAEIRRMMPKAKSLVPGG
jgi:hypothetical protein